MKDRIELLLAEIGYSDRLDDHALIVYLRDEAIKWACILGISECQKLAVLKFKEAFENSTEIR